MVIKQYVFTAIEPESFSKIRKKYAVNPAKFSTKSYRICSVFWGVKPVAMLL
jgi:hypothetical protein